MKLREDDQMDPQVERELAAIDAARRGDAVEADLADLAELSGEIAELRPSPEESFAARMDRKVAAGFDTGEGRENAFGIASAWERFRSIPMTRRLMPVGAIALAAVVAVTTVVSLNSGGAGSTDSNPGAEGDTAAVAQSADAGGGKAASAPIPSTVESPESAAGPARLPKGASNASTSAIGGQTTTGPYASGEKRRYVERNAQLTLGTDPGKVGDVTDDVLGIVGRYDGIVLNSSVSDGPAGDAGAEFELLIPSARLGDALANLSGVAEVRSRAENTKDITAPTVTTGDRLREARAEVEGLLKQLAAADTDAERQSAEEQLSFQRQRVAGLRSALNSLKRRANLSRVSLEVVTGDASSFGSADGGRWTIEDALADAGRILATAAAVTLVGLAILAPFALLALLFWLGRRGWVAGSRRRVLEG